MARTVSRNGFAWVMVGLTSLWVGASWLGCSEETTSTPTTTTQPGTGGTGTTSTTASGGSATTTTTSTTTTSSSTSSTTTSGSGGEGGSGGSWPTCDTPPNGVPTKTISQIWNDNPTTETAAWVPDVLVTGISWGACTAGHRCQIYLQQDATYANLTAAQHQAIMLRISSAAAERFTGLAVGDRLNVYAHAVRETDNGENELMLVVNNYFRGCAIDVGDDTPVPVPGVALSDLTIAAYEETVGPVFVQVQDVSGNPDAADEYFALWTTGGPINADAGLDAVVSLSPYLMSSGSFTGLTNGLTTNFDYVQGVFAMYVPSVDGGTAPKYKSVSPRAAADYPILP